MTRTIDIEALCADKGLRITEQRKVIARVLGDSEDHPDVETLHARASAIDPNISIATVYRTVRLSRKPGFWSGMSSATVGRATKPRRKLTTTI